MPYPYIHSVFFVINVVFWFWCFMQSLSPVDVIKGLTRDFAMIFFDTGYQWKPYKDFVPVAIGILSVVYTFAYAAIWIFCRLR